MRTIALNLLGGFDVRTDDGAVVSLPTQKYKALLAFLATPAGRSHARDGLIALLWSDLPHEQARGALRQALWALRRSLNGHAGAVLLLHGDAVALDPAAVTVDVARFLHAAAQSEPGALAEAAALYRGAFLAGMSAREAPFEEWLIAERERLAQRAITTLGRLLAAQRAAGALDDAVQTTLRLLALDPLQEAVHRTLMQLYVQLGRRGTALRQYQSCVAVLQRELGAEPESSTRALYQEILRPRPTDPIDRDAAPGATASSLADTPIIGRDRELAQLRDALNDAAAGSGRVAVVVGEAGIGKSRLVDELLAEAAATGARVMTGRAHESDDVLPLGPWADALRDAGVARDAGLLASLPPACVAELARFVPELGSPPPAPGYDAYGYAQVFEGVIRLVTTLAARSPLVIVLEDLHWADQMSVRLVSFLARRIHRQVRVLLVLTAREEDVHVTSPLHRALDDLEHEFPPLQLALAPLPREDTLALVRTLTAGRDERRGEAICDASEGHPFTVIEMVRALGENGDAETSAGVTLPQRVRHLIERRLEHVSAGAQRLIAAAAVIGRDFDYALLQQASGLEEDDAVSALEELVRRRIFHAIGERFEFTHARLREVAYALLLPPRRKLLHRRVATALATLNADDLAGYHGALGGHYAEADVWDRAARHLYAAAASAHERMAYREGAVLLDRALGALARLPRTHEMILLEIDVRLRLFRCLNPLGDPGATAHVTRAQALVTEAPDESREAVILVEVAELRRFARELGPALDAGERALALASRSDEPRLVALAHFQLGVAHLARGAYAEAIAHLTSTVAGLAAAPLRDRLGYPYIPALCRLSWASADLGDLAAAERYAEDAMRIAETTQHALSLAEASTAIGLLHLLGDRTAEAIPPLERAMHLGRTWQIAYIRAFSASWLALAYARDGRAADATALLDECERGRVWEHVRLQWSRIVVRLAEARLLLGDGRRARALAGEGLALARSIGEPAGEADARALLATFADES